MSGESLADLLLRVGVDSSDIVQGFANANRKAAQAGREMAETVNNALSRIEFTALGVNAQDAVRTATNTMLKEAIEARTIIENHDRLRAQDMLNQYNESQALRTAELANIQETAKAETEIVERSLQMQAALRRRYAAEIAKAEADRRQDKLINGRVDPTLPITQQDLNAANQRDALQFHHRRAASLRNMQQMAADEQEITERSAKLREAILARYALQDEEKAARRASVAARLQQKLDQDSDRIKEQGSRAAVDRAEAERKVTRRVAEEGNRYAKERRDLEQEALSIVRATESADDAHERRKRRLNFLLKQGVLEQREYNAALAASERVRQSQRAGGGQMSGILAQLSFGIEDFAQGIAMGDFRAAMLGASNNISMVIRGLKDMDAAGRASFITLMKFPLIAGAFVGIGVAALAIAHHIKNANTELRTLADRIAEATRQYFRLRQADEMATRRQRQSDELAKITEIEDIEAKRRQAELDHADLMRRLDTERNENNVKGREAILKMLGGEANMIELQQYLANKNNLESQMALQALSRAQQAALKGNAAVVFQEMRALFNYLDKEAFKDIPGNMTPQGMVGGRFLFDMAALNELQKYFKQGSIFNAFYGDSEEALKEVQGVLDEIAKDESKSLAERQAAERLLLEIKTRQGEIVAEQAEQEKFNAEQAERQHEIRKQRALFDAESFKRMQQEQIFLINATEHERELLRLKEQQSKVTRPGALLTGFDPIMNALMQQENENLQQQDRIAFLQAQRKAVENEIFQLQMQQVPKPQGALEQNAFQAQASAFKQMMENANQKPNPQMTRMISLLQSIDAAMQNGGIIQGVP